MRYMQETCKIRDSEEKRADKKLGIQWELWLGPTEQKASKN